MGNGEHDRSDGEKLPFEEQIKRRDGNEGLLRQAKKVLLPEMKDNSSKRI